MKIKIIIKRSKVVKDVYDIDVFLDMVNHLTNVEDEIKQRLKMLKPKKRRIKEKKIHLEWR